MPQRPPSRPLPDCFIPPKGAPAPRDVPFISTMPDRSPRANLFARAILCLNIVGQAVNGIVSDFDGLSSVLKASLIKPGQISSRMMVMCYCNRQKQLGE